MTRDELIAIIYRTHAAPYGEFLPAGLRQQLTISAGLAADAIIAAAKAKQARTVTPMPERTARRKAG